MVWTDMPSLMLNTGKLGRGESLGASKMKCKHIPTTHRPIIHHNTSHESARMDCSDGTEWGQKPLLLLRVFYLFMFLYIICIATTTCTKHYYSKEWG